MKTRFTIIFTVISLIGAACGTQDSADKSGPHDGTNHNAGSGPLKSGNENAIDHSKMDHSSMGHSMTSSPNAASAEYDLQFIDTMIAHHQAAIDMAKLIDRRTERPELKTLGGNVVVSQQSR